MSKLRNATTDELHRELDYRNTQDTQQACPHEFFIRDVNAHGATYWINVECGYCGFRREIDSSPQGRRLKLSINREELWDR